MAHGDGGTAARRTYRELLGYKGFGGWEWPWQARTSETLPLFRRRLRMNQAHIGVNQAECVHTQSTSPVVPQCNWTMPKELPANNSRQPAKWSMRQFHCAPTTTENVELCHELRCLPILSAELEIAAPQLFPPFPHSLGGYSNRRGIRRNGTAPRVPVYAVSKLADPLGGSHRAGKDFGDDATPNLIVLSCKNTVKEKTHDRTRCGTTSSDTLARPAWHRGYEGRGDHAPSAIPVASYLPDSLGGSGVHGQGVRAPAAVRRFPQAHAGPGSDAVIATPM